MMHFHITSIGSYALDILNSNSEGRIHSVYRKTINIQIGACLLALQAVSSPMSPVSLITDLDSPSMEKLPLFPGLAVKIKSGTLSITGSDSIFHFCYSEAAIYESELTSKSPLLSQNMLKSILDCSSAGGFSTIFTEQDLEADLAAAAAKAHLTACHTFMQISDYNKAADELVSLIGLGMGLTPSGDDFLCGVLAGLILTGNSDHPFTATLKGQISANLCNTNDISRTFLRCALSSHFSKPIKDLLHPASPEDILASFEAVGHSSGIDSLSGIYYALTLVCD